MKKAFIIMAAVVGVSIVLAFYGISRKETPAVAGTVRVTASFYTLAHFTGKVGKEAVVVHSVTPAGTESHDFEPTAQDINRIYSSRLFIYNGGGFDAWADSIRAEVEKKGVSTMNIAEALGLAAEAGQHEDREHGHGGLNPHFWLDPLMAIKEVEAIRDGLSKAYPAGAAAFHANAEAYIKELQGLHQRYETGLRDCGKKDVIVSHDAFSRLSERYAINFIPVVGISAEEEPSARRIREITRIVREKSIDYIFFETLVSPKIAETIARETGARTLVLDPIEGVITEKGGTDADYIGLMDKNLQNLRTALSCR